MCSGAREEPTLDVWPEVLDKGGQTTRMVERRAGAQSCREPLPGWLLSGAFHPRDLRESPRGCPVVGVEPRDL